MAKDLVISSDVVTNKIHVIRGCRVMLDRDLAQLYAVKAIRLREQVTRNRSRFPENFMFRLNKTEALAMVSQNAIPSMKYFGGSMPYAFTEHGILMLANVLNSDRAITMSIRIIEIFVKYREALTAHKDILLKIDQLERAVEDHDGRIKLIFKYLKELLHPKAKPARKIGFRQMGNG